MRVCLWKGEKGTIWPLKDRLIGNKSLYNENNLANLFSINFITSHDGFTLKDLVSFNKKHNLANGENNRDGENNNNSFNCGVEGPTTNKEINIVRQRQQRNQKGKDEMIPPKKRNACFLTKK